MSRFDSVAVVDWSASSSLSPARPSADAIWIGQAGRESCYFRGRSEAEAALRALIAQEQGAGRRLLIGSLMMYAPVVMLHYTNGVLNSMLLWAHLKFRMSGSPKQPW